MGPIMGYGHAARAYIQDTLSGRGLGLTSQTKKQSIWSFEQPPDHFHSALANVLHHHLGASMKECSY